MIKFISIILFLFLSIPAQQAEAASSKSGVAIYEVLHKNHLMDNYMIDVVEEISQDLVSATGQWSEVRINKPYSKSAINIYLIDSKQLPPKANILEPYGVMLGKDSFQGNALAHEATNILFVDTDLIKSIITVAQMSTNQDNLIWYAVAKIKAYGIENFRQLWDPKINTKLAMAWHSDNGLLLASGSLAFIIAHEIGHIAIDKKTRVKRQFNKFKGKDRDRRWACSNLVEKKYQNQQMIEREVDDYAVMLLSKILFPPGVMNKPLFRYELGARWYMTYGLSKQIVASLGATEDPFIHSDMRQDLGAEVYNLLIGKKSGTGRGLVKVYFPKNHPANIRRTSVSLNKLAQSQYSWYHGVNSVDSGMKVFEMFLDRECQKIKPKDRK